MAGLAADPPEDALTRQDVGVIGVASRRHRQVTDVEAHQIGKLTMRLQAIELHAAAVRR